MRKWRAQPIFCLCPQRDREGAREEAVEGLGAWLEAVGTDPPACSCLASALLTRKPDQHFVDMADKLVMVATQDQDKIRWVSVMEARTSLPEMEKLQQEHYLLQGSKQTARKWAEALVMNLFVKCHGPCLI